MRSMEDGFNDLGIDAITGTEIMRLTGTTPVDFTDPARYQRFKDVLEHLKSIEDKQFYISRIVTGKNVDKLDHLWGYVELEKSKIQKQQEAEKIESSYQEASKNRELLINDISKIQDEMSHYER